MKERVLGAVGLTLGLSFLLATPVTATPVTATPVVATPATAAPAKAEARPNIVVIMVDDMRDDEMPWMPRTRALLDQFELTEFVSNHPLCCPARAEFLTGQFGHHNGVHHNPGAYGGYDALLEKNNTIASWFDDEGYTTSLAGKFVNGWTGSWGKPDGWDRFSALDRGTYSAYDFDVWRDGVTRTYTKIHNNDFVTAESVRQLDKAAADGAPFFHYAAYTSPHGYVDEDGKWLNAPVPAKRHADMFSRARPPSASAPSYDPPEGMRVRWTFRQRIRSLQSVDEGVQAIVDATKRNGTYADTVFVFTSDNGYLLGEHGLRGKNVPYEEALQVPLLAAGPGIPTGSSAKGSMITDLAPSLSGLAGVTPGRPQDGRSDLFSDTGGWTSLLVQAGSDDPDLPWWWRGVREQNWVYVRFADRAPMLFNLRRDPYELVNLHGRRPRVEERLKAAIPEVAGFHRQRTSPRPLARQTEANG